MAKDYPSGIQAKTIEIGKDTLLNITCWDWEILKSNPDSVDWIPALRALEELEKLTRVSHALHKN